MYGRTFRYLALASSTVLSGVAAYKFTCHNDMIYAAGLNTTPEQPYVLRSGLASHDLSTWNKNWDFRENVESKVKHSDKNYVPSLAELSPGDQINDSNKRCNGESSSATRHLVFIRHGQYVKADEAEDKILTKLGRQQAKATGERLKLLHQGKYPIDKLVISSMARAKESGDIIRESLPDVQFEYCDFLPEGAPCLPEPPSTKWKPDYHIFQDSARIEAAFRRYIHRADPEQKKDTIEVYVCHANVIRYFVCRALQFPPEGWLRMSTGHCGITWISINSKGRVSLRSMGDTGHLPPELLTSS